MKDLHSGERLFSYVISGLEGPTNSPSSIGFYDSAGNRMSVNYIHVEVHYDAKSTENHAVIRFEVSGTGASGSLLTNSAVRNDFALSSVLNGDVSGVCGGIVLANTHNGVFEWKAPNSEIANGLTFCIEEHLHGGLGGASDNIEMVVTYGTITPFNTLRLDRYDRGV